MYAACLGSDPDPRPARRSLSGCGHTDPFTSPPYGTDAPFDPAPPVRLTLNPLADRGGAWLPDGSGILYSAQQIGRDGSRRLPRPALAHRRTSTGADLRSHGRGRGLHERHRVGRARRRRPARVRRRRARGSVPRLRSREGIAIAPTLDPRGATIRFSRFPTRSPASRRTHHVTALRWLGPARSASSGGTSRYLSDCIGCPTAIPSSANLKVVTMDAAGGSAARRRPGNRLRLRALRRGARDDEIYYTLGGDSRVFRRTLSTGDGGRGPRFRRGGHRARRAGGRRTAGGRRRRARGLRRQSGARPHAA